MMVLARRVSVLCSAVVLASLCGNAPALAQTTGWYTGAGGHIDFGGCPSSGTDCHIVGTTVGATLLDIYVAAEEGSDSRQGSYGFGIGHLTSLNHKNWAVIENGGTTVVDPNAPTDEWSHRTPLRRACSLFGHAFYLGAPSGTPSRVEDHSTDQSYWAHRHAPMDFGIGLFLTGWSACAAAIPWCNQQVLEWRCEFAGQWQSHGASLPVFNTYLPMYLTPSTRVYLPRGEDVATADHGFFSRDPTPAQMDSADTAFFDSRFIYFSDSNPIEGCDPMLPNVCRRHVTWLEDTDNYADWSGVSFYEDPLIGLHTYVQEQRKWNVCLGDGGPCGPTLPTCNTQRILWRYGFCQEKANWCWVGGPQSIVRHMLGVLRSQCDLVRDVHWFWCPDVGGFPNNVQQVLTTEGLSIADYRTHNDVVARLMLKPVTPVPTFEEIRGWIDQGKPIVVGVKWTSSYIWHLLVVVGYKCHSGKQFIYYLDPASRSGGCVIPLPSQKSTRLEVPVEYSWFATGGGRWEWWDSTIVGQ